jgi:hypothetical protein
MKGYRKYTALTLLTALAVACSGSDAVDASDVDIAPSVNGMTSTEGTAPAQTAGPDTSPDAEVQVVARSVLLHRIELSPTHRIDFIEYPELGTAAVEERFHAALDGMESRLKATGLSADDPLDTVYAALAGESMDWNVAEKLRGVEERLGATPLDLESMTPFEPTPLADDSPIGRTSQAICAEPAWDWVADDQWFRNTYCGFGFQYCDSLDASHNAKRRGRNEEAYFFNQSFCSAATLTNLARIAYSCHWLWGCSYINVILDQHGVDSGMVLGKFHRASKRDEDDQWPEYKASITSAQGNFTGMSFFVFND